jgi:hypothetical protein
MHDRIDHGVDRAIDLGIDTGVGRGLWCGILHVGARADGGGGLDEPVRVSGTVRPFVIGANHARLHGE